MHRISTEHRQLSAKTPHLEGFFDEAGRDSNSMYSEYLKTALIPSGTIWGLSILWS